MKISDYLTADEMQQVTARSDLRGGLMLLVQWALFVGILWAAAVWPNPLTVIGGTVLLGGRMLGFGVLAHECGHRTLFKTQWLNDFVGEWIVSPPRFGNNRAYMRGHLQHHRLAGTDTDPDLKNYQDYPITTRRLRRKLARDLTGRIGWREVRSIGRGILKIRRLDSERQRVLVLGLIFNVGLLVTVTLLGAPWLFVMWAVAFVVVNPTISRIRQVAEHGAVPDLYDGDPRNNTRTVLANPLARLLFAPHRVNYHLEHHMMASVPAYRLALLHRLLETRGAYADVTFPRGYRALLREVTRAEAPLAA